jgi:hypothetical protein
VANLIWDSIISRVEIMVNQHETQVVVLITLTNYDICPLNTNEILGARLRPFEQESIIVSFFKKGQHNGEARQEPLSIQRWMFRLDHICTFLSNHVYSILDSAVRNDREDRSIDNTKVLDAVNFELCINYTLLNVL